MGLLIIALIGTGAYFLALKMGIIWKDEVDEKKYPVRGIEVSERNDKISWKIVADKMSFALIKGTEGVDRVDSKLKQN
jgi:GH25 family lysozyme M1 (1,4-beta-N-acetylmuramidase)